MTAMTKAKRSSAAEYYDYAAISVPTFTVLNYGFSSDPEDSVLSPEDAEFFCLRLYEHTVRATPLRDRDVLEVSCGRGGGASFLMRYHAPRRYVGIDISEENIRMGAARHDGPEFLVGDAEALEFPDDSFDVVINIESSHLYEDRTRFFAEVHRVLKPGGRFCYTDGCWADDDCTHDLIDAGFEIEERLEITANVIRSLQKDSARRAAIFDTLPDLELREEYKDWGGVVGYRAYRRFVEGRTRYFSHRLLRRSSPYLSSHSTL